MRIIYGRSLMDVYYCGYIDDYSGNLRWKALIRYDTEGDESPLLAFLGRLNQQFSEVIVYVL